MPGTKVYHPGFAVQTGPAVLLAAMPPIERATVESFALSAARAMQIVSCHVKLTTCMTIQVIQFQQGVEVYASNQVLSSPFCPSDRSCSLIDGHAIS